MGGYYETKDVVARRRSEGDFVPPKSPPSWDRLEWLEHWASPGGCKWARQRAIASLSGRNKAVSIEADFDERYRQYLKEWISIYLKH